MNPHVPTALLKMTRENANLSQAELATALKVNKSIISRLENTENADFLMAERYLSAVNTDLARQILGYYNQHWEIIERPLFTHPEREILWEAEQSILRLDNFEKTPQFDSILQEPLSKLRKRLIAEANFIKHVEHNIAFIGNIGVGKTTALSFITNLTMKMKSGKDIGKIKSVFPTGSGRTTICEVAIITSPMFGIAVDNLTEEEIRQEVSILVDGLKTKKGGLPTEIDRAIRNMAGLTRVTESIKEGNEKVDPKDPIKEMIDREEDTDQIVAKIMSQMKLDTRTKTQVILPENIVENLNLEWLSTNIAKINYGQHSEFSIPKRITVLLPLKIFSESPYLLSIVDTKGVEGTTQRLDLKNQIDDHRTITVLCTGFPNVPGDTPISIIKDVINSGSDAINDGRLCLLVLPKNDEALKVINDIGETPTTDNEGYSIREYQIKQTFETEELPSIPVEFYNAERDKPQNVWKSLTSMIENVRLRKIGKIKQSIDAVNSLVTNSDVAKDRQARCDIAKTMEQTAERFQNLPKIIKPAYINLTEQLKKIHHRSIAASVNSKRRGKWNNCLVSYFLEFGVRNDANFRTKEIFIRIDEQLEGLKAQYTHLAGVRQFIESIQYDITNWKQEFLNRAALTGQTSFATHLEKATQLWSDCEKESGSGYRNNICGIFDKHFETDIDAIVVQKRIEISLMKIWTELVIEPLKKAVYFP